MQLTAILTCLRFSLAGGGGAGTGTAKPVFFFIGSQKVPVCLMMLNALPAAGKGYTPGMGGANPNMNCGGGPPLGCGSGWLPSGLDGYGRYGGG